MADETIRTIFPHNEISSEPENVQACGMFVTEKVPSKADDALDFLRAAETDDFAFTKSEAVKVRWKIDLILMPLVREK